MKKDNKKVLEDNNILDFPEAAELLRLSHPSLYRWLSQGKIRGFKVGKKWRFYRNDLLEFAKETDSPGEESIFNEIRSFFADRRNSSICISNYKKDGILENLFAHAISAGADYIHLDPMSEDRLKVSYRIDGRMVKIIDLPSAVKYFLRDEISLAFCLKGKYNKGRFFFDERHIKVFVIETLQGIKYTIKISKRKEDRGSLTHILENKKSSLLKEILKQTSGLILVVQPPGRNNRDFMYSLLKEAVNSGRLSFTMEREPEYVIEGISQFRIDRDADYEEACELIEGNDFDLIMFDRIKTSQVMDLCLERSFDNLVMAGIEGDGSLETFFRIIRGGVKKRLLINSLAAIISERYIRKVCPFCSEVFVPEEKLMSRLFTEPLQSYSFLKPGGCIKCNYTGYRGRIFIYEVICVDKEIRAMLYNNKSPDSIRKKVGEKGLKTFYEEVMKWALRKMTTFEELLNASVECGSAFQQGESLWKNLSVL